jgi:hypothetical protein
MAIRGVRAAFITALLLAGAAASQAGGWPVCLGRGRGRGPPRGPPAASGQGGPQKSPGRDGAARGRASRWPIAAARLRGSAPPAPPAAPGPRQRRLGGIRNRSGPLTPASPPPRRLPPPPARARAAPPPPSAAAASRASANAGSCLDRLSAAANSCSGCLNAANKVAYGRLDRLFGARGSSSFHMDAGRFFRLAVSGVG